MTDLADAWEYFKHYAPFNNPMVQERVWLKWNILCEFLKKADKERLVTAWTKALNTGSSAEFQLICEEIDMAWKQETKH